MGLHLLRITALYITLSAPALLCANSTTTRGGSLSVRSHGGTAYTIEATLLLTAYPAPTDSFTIRHNPSGPNNPAFGYTGFMTDYPCVQTADGVLVSISVPQTMQLGAHNIYLHAGERVPNIANITVGANNVFSLFCFFDSDTYIGPNGLPFTDSLNLQANFPLGIVTTVPNVLYDDEGDSIRIVFFQPLGCTAYNAPETVGGGGFVLYPDDSTYEWDPQLAGVYSICFVLYEYCEYGTGNWLMRGFSMREVLLDAGVASAISEHAAGEMHVYPNPAADRIWFTEVQACAELLNAQGEVVLSASQTSSLDISALAAGVYFLRTGSGMQTVVIE
jgi:hypothetical protein